MLIVFELLHFVSPAGNTFEEHVLIADYNASNDNELSVKAGDVVMVITKGEEGKKGELRETRFPMHAGMTDTHTPSKVDTQDIKIIVKMV